ATGTLRSRARAWKGRRRPGSHALRQEVRARTASLLQTQEWSETGACRTRLRDKTGALRLAIALLLIGLGFGSLSDSLQPRVPICPALTAWLRRLLFEDRSGLVSRRSLLPRLYELV